MSPYTPDLVLLRIISGWRTVAGAGTMAEIRCRTKDERGSYGGNVARDPRTGPTGRCPPTAVRRDRGRGQHPPGQPAEAGAGRPASRDPRLGRRRRLG